MSLLTQLLGLSVSSVIPLPVSQVFLKGVRHRSQALIQDDLPHRFPLLTIHSLQRHSAPPVTLVEFSGERPHACRHCSSVGLMHSSIGLSQNARSHATSRSPHSWLAGSRVVFPSCC